MLHILEEPSTVWIIPLRYTSVCTAVSQRLVGSAEHHAMSFEMYQDKHGIINNFIIGPQNQVEVNIFLKTISVYFHLQNCASQF